MSNQLTIQNQLTAVTAFENQRIESNKLIVHNKLIKRDEIYPLSEIPGENTGLVTLQKQDALGAIELDKLLFQLSLCVDLYQIVYNAVNGIEGLHANIGQLRIKFCDTLRKSDVTVYEFKQTTTSVIDMMMLTFNLLADGEKETALEILAGIGDTAADMVKKCGELAKSFIEIKDDTALKLKDVTSKNEEFYKKFEQFKEEEAKLKASLDAYTSLATSYEQKSKELQSDIDDTKADIKKQEDRAFTMAIISTIMGSVNSLASTAAKAYNPLSGVAGVMDSISGKDTSKQSTESGDSTPAGGGTTKPPQDVVDKYNVSNKKCNDIKEKNRKIDERIAQIDEVINAKEYAQEEKKDIPKDKKKDTEKTEKELIEEKTALNKQKQDNLTELGKENQNAEAYRASLAALGCAFDRISGDLKEMSGKAEQKAANLNTELKDLRTQKRDIDSLYITNLSKMKETSEKIKHSLQGQKDVDVAIDSLILAIGALNNIISFLEMITMFWEKIEVSCKTLGTNISNIRLMSKSLTVASIMSKTFVYPYFRSMAHWIALNLIFTEYLDAMDKAHAKMSDSIRSPEMSRESHWKQAKNLADELGQKLGVEIAIIDKRMKD